MNKRHLLPVAALMAGGMVLTACSGGEGSSESGELDSLSIMAPYFAQVPPEDDGKVGQALSELTGLDLQMQWVPNSSYGAKINTVLAGSSIPDVMVITEKTQAFVSTAEAGGFWDLTEHLASGEYPNLVTDNPDVQQAASVNGTVYGIYRARDVIRSCVIIRKDWLNNLGLEPPETTEDLVKIARAFTEEDPDNDGKDDTYGLIVPKWPGGIGTNSPWDTMEVWYGAGNMWREDGGELVPAFTTPEWREALEYERTFVENGYINADYATMDPAKWNEPFLNGKGGIIIDVQSRAAQLRNLFKEKDSATYQDKVLMVGQLEGPNGTFALPTTGFSGFLAIPKSSVQTEEQLDQVLDALNEMNSKEGQVLLNNGIEGYNFTVDDEGYAVYDESKQDFSDQVSGAWAQLGTNVTGEKYYRTQPENEADKKFRDKRERLQAEDLKNAAFNPAAALVSETYTSKGTRLDNLIADARIQYLAGQIDEAGLDAAIERWRTSGGEQVTTEINKLYDDLG